MSGVELITGGWFASAVIGKLVDKGQSYLGNNYNLHTGTRKMLTNLENQLPYIQSVIEAAEKRQITNTGVIKWMEKLKDAAYEASDVLDKFEVKRNHESLKGKGKITEIASSSGKMIRNLFFPDKDLKELNSVVTKLDDLCKENLINILCALIHDEKKKRDLGNLDRKTGSVLVPGVPIFGRDREIVLILDMILNVLYGDFYHQFLDDSNLQQGEDAGSSSFPGRIFKSFLYWGKSGKSIVQKVYVPEQSKKGWLDSMSSETGKKGDNIVKHGDNIVKPISTVTESDSITNGKLAVIPIVGVGGVGKRKGT